jgi:hypothetical protein
MYLAALTQRFHLCRVFTILVRAVLKEIVVRGQRPETKNRKLVMFNILIYSLFPSFRGWLALCL